MEPNVDLTNGLRILVVDDHPIVREGMAQLLNRQSDMRVEWEANGIAEAIAICKTHRPDFAIVDVALVDGCGLELVRQMHEIWSTLPILMLSMHDEALYAHRALHAGARGYLMKQAVSKNIIGAIRRIQAGEIFLSEKMKTAMLDRVLSGGDGAMSTALARLTDHELEIFQLIGAGLKKAEIATRLRRSVNTVEAHRSNIKKKLNVSSSAELARHAFLYFNNAV